MKNYPSSTLIVCTYNSHKTLEMCSLSIQNQTQIPNEVLIADDGSGKETAELIQKFQKYLSVPLIHIWHEDIGFRLSEIRNKAICKAKFEYIIQIDSDCILHRNFVKDHLKFAKKNTFLLGSRVFINETSSKKYQKTKNIKFNYFSKGIETD